MLGCALRQKRTFEKILNYAQNMHAEHVGGTNHIRTSSHSCPHHVPPQKVRFKRSNSKENTCERSLTLKRGFRKLGDNG
jgi:hypothetical protein